MAAQAAELFKILNRQIGEDAEIDPVLGEAPRVLPEAELLKQSETCCIAAPRLVKHLDRRTGNLI
jgi:hypothetical protein